MIKSDVIAQENEVAAANLNSDYAALGEHLDRRGIDIEVIKSKVAQYGVCLLYTSPSPRDQRGSRMPSSA